MSIGPTPPLGPTTHSTPAQPQPQAAQPDIAHSHSQQLIRPAGHAPASARAPLSNTRTEGAGPIQPEQPSADRDGDGRLGWHVHSHAESDCQHCQDEEEKLQKSKSGTSEQCGSQLDLEG